jgi:eukaryotic-like serine/threonine-protein kinase
MEQMEHSALAPGKIIGDRYRLKERLAAGGVGEVWVAEHCHLKHEVAVKFLKEDLLGDRSAADGVLERFRFESQVSAMLGRRTRHVVAVHDAGDSEFGPFLAMEYVSGRSLSEELKMFGPMQAARLGTILEQVADALEAAHALGIVHRDIKPANILVCDEPDGSPFVKVADFGIAKTTNLDLFLDLPRVTSATLLVGTPDFMSPEQVRRAMVQSATDIWALGVTCYKLLVGKLPFNAASGADKIVKILSEPFLAPSTIRPELPVALDAWFLRALAKEPADRFASVKEMSDAYRAAIIGPVSRPISLAFAISRPGSAATIPRSERGTARIPTSAEAAASAELVPTQVEGSRRSPPKICPSERATVVSGRAATLPGERPEPTRPRARRRRIMVNVIAVVIAAGLLVLYAPNDPAAQRAPADQAAQPAELESTAVPAKLTNNPPAPAPAMAPRRSKPPNRGTIAASSKAEP